MYLYSLHYLYGQRAIPKITPEEEANILIHCLSSSKQSVGFVCDQNRIMTGGYLQLYLKNSNGENITCIGQVGIFPVENNCGTIQITGLTSYLPKTANIGSILLREALKFCEAADYSFVICNTAGSDQNKWGIKTLLGKFGFQPMGPAYINKRSNYLNVWYCKMLSDVESVDNDEIFDKKEPVKEVVTVENKLRARIKGTYHEEDEDDEDF